jgi:hypothetical protein
MKAKAGKQKVSTPRPAATADVRETKRPIFLDQLAMIEPQ